MQFVASIKKGNYDTILAGNDEAILSIGEQSRLPAIQQSYLLAESDRR
jgi:hypothetical protein